MNQKPIKPPKHLNRAAKKLWRELQAEYGIADAGGLALLQTACECWAEMEQAREILDREGMTIESDTTGFKRLNPAAKALKEARASFFRAISMLNLDVAFDGPALPKKGGWKVG